MLPISELDTHSLSSPPLHLSISLVSVSSAGACYSSQLETDASTPIRPQRMVTSLVHTVLRRQGKGSHGLRAAPRRPARHIHTFCVCVCVHTQSLAQLSHHRVSKAQKPQTQVLRETRSVGALTGHVPLW